MHNRKMNKSGYPWAECVGRTLPDKSLTGGPRHDHNAIKVKLGARFDYDAEAEAVG